MVITLRAILLHDTERDRVLIDDRMDMTLGLLLVQVSFRYRTNLKKQFFSPFFCRVVLALYRPRKNSRLRRFFCGSVRRMSTVVVGRLSTEAFPRVAAAARRRRRLLIGKSSTK